MEIPCNYLNFFKKQQGGKVCSEPDRHRQKSGITMPVILFTVALILLNVNIHNLLAACPDGSFDASVKVGVAQLFEVQAGEPEGENVTYTVDWADGSTYTTEPLQPATAKRVVHTWLMPRSTPYAVTVTAKDIQQAISLPSDNLRVCVEGGDLNTDNALNIQDVQLLVNVILGIETNAALVKEADINGDGEVNIVDLQIVINLVLGV